MNNKPLFATVTIKRSKSNSYISENSVNVVDATTTCKTASTSAKMRRCNYVVSNSHSNNTDCPNAVANSCTEMSNQDCEVTIRIPMTLSMTVRELAETALHRFTHSRHCRRFFPKLQCEPKSFALSVKSISVRSSEIPEAEVFVHDIVCDVIDVNRELVVIVIEKVVKQQELEESHQDDKNDKEQAWTLEESRKRLRSFVSTDDLNEEFYKKEECKRARCMNSDVELEPHEPSPELPRNSQNNKQNNSHVTISNKTKNIDNSNLFREMEVSASNAESVIDDKQNSTTKMSEMEEKKDVTINHNNYPDNDNNNNNNRNINSITDKELPIVQEQNDISSADISKNRRGKVTRQLGWGPEAHKHFASNYVSSPEKLMRQQYKALKKCTNANNVNDESYHVDSQVASAVQLEKEKEICHLDSICIATGETVKDEKNAHLVRAITSSDNSIQGGDVSRIKSKNNKGNIHDEDDSHVIEKTNIDAEHMTPVHANCKEWACSEQSNGSSTTEAAICTQETCKTEQCRESANDVCGVMNTECITNVISEEEHLFSAAPSVSIVETTFTPMKVIYKSSQETDEKLQEQEEEQEDEQEQKSREQEVLQEQEREVENLTLEEVNVIKSNIQITSQKINESQNIAMLCTQGTSEEQVIICEPPTIAKFCTPLRRGTLHSNKSAPRPLGWGVDAEKYFDKDTYCDDPNKAKIKSQPVISPVPELTPSASQTNKPVGIRPHRNVHLPPYFQLLLSEEDYYDFKDDEM